MLWKLGHACADVADVDVNNCDVVHGRCVWICTGVPRGSLSADRFCGGGGRGSSSGRDGAESVCVL